MSKHDDDTCPHLVRASLLEVENARLKAENAWIKGEEYVHTELGSLVPRRLLEHWIEKAKDLEKMKNEFREIGLSLDEENDRLKAEVERLRKAGDELSIAFAAFHLIHRGRIDTTTQPDIVAWTAAKEGKPSV